MMTETGGSIPMLVRKKTIRLSRIPKPPGIITTTNPINTDDVNVKIKSGIYSIERGVKDTPISQNAIPKKSQLAKIKDPETIKELILIVNLPWNWETDKNFESAKMKIVNKQTTPVSFIIAH
jgi:hypothetical protein